MADAKFLRSYRNFGEIPDDTGAGSGTDDVSGKRNNFTLVQRPAGCSLDSATYRAAEEAGAYAGLLTDSLSAQPAKVTSMPRPRLSEITRLFTRVGITVFGGGDPTIAILQREFYRRDWLSPEKFAIAFGLARLTPGTNVLAFCAAAGWYILGLTGALARSSPSLSRLRSWWCGSLAPMTSPRTAGWRNRLRARCSRPRSAHDRRGPAAGPARNASPADG